MQGPSDRPDPRFAAYRQDLADAALAGRVIASHYAEPLRRVIARPEPLYSGPSDSCEVLATLARGDAFDMLDCTLGWAWGYAGPERRVGYVRKEAIAIS